MIYSQRSEKYRNLTLLDGMPSQTVSYHEKTSPHWQAACMDFLDSVAQQQRPDRLRDIKNFKLLDPDYELRDYEFINDPLSLGEDREMLYGAMDDVKHFPIMTRPVNAIVGERINRPFNFFAVSTASRSRNEYHRVKTTMLFDSVMSQIIGRIREELIASGMKENDPKLPEAIQAKTPEEIQEYVDVDHLDVLEQISQRLMRNKLKTEGLQSKFIDGFRNVVTCAKEFYHVYESGHSAKVDLLSSAEVFYHKTPSEPFIHKSSYAGFERWYTLSSLIDIYRNELTTEEVEYLEEKTNPHLKRKRHQENAKTGISSISYDTDTYRDWTGNTFAQYGDHLESLIEEFHAHGATSMRYNTNGLIKVVHGYWISYQPIGWLTGYDNEGNEYTQLVSEHYEPDTSQGEFIEWEYVPQVYRGTKIDSDVYIAIRPDENQDFDENDPYGATLPIFGRLYNNFMTKPISPIDLMKPWNEIYNIVAHSLKKDLKKSLDTVMFMSYDHIPNVPGFTKEKWLYWLREFGIAWVSDNGKRSQFSHFSAHDLSLATSMVNKMDLLERIKYKCDEFAGFTQPRLGRTDQVDTAKQAQQSTYSSVTQTEYYFYKHYELIEQVLNRVLAIDLKHVGKNPNMRNLLNDMEQRYIDFNPDHIDPRKVGLFITNSFEDARKRADLMGAVNVAVQRGADPIDYAAAILAETESEVRAILKRIKKERMAQAQAEQQLKQQELELRAKEMASREKLEYAKLENNKEVAYIRTFAFPDADNTKDSNNDQIPDIVQYQELMLKAEGDLRKQLNESSKLALETQKHVDQVRLEREKMDIERGWQDVELKNQENDLKVAAKHAQGRPKSK